MDEFDSMIKQQTTMTYTAIIINIIIWIAIVIIITKFVIIPHYQKKQLEIEKLKLENQKLKDQESQF
jgi:uncharacterized membrane-anchored protein YhcB (DUF1043 family)